MIVPRKGPQLQNLVLGCIAKRMWGAKRWGLWLRVTQKDTDEERGRQSGNRQIETKKVHGRFRFVCVCVCVCVCACVPGAKWKMCNNIERDKQPAKYQEGKRERIEKEGEGEGVLRPRHIYREICVCMCIYVCVSVCDIRVLFGTRWDKSDWGK